MLEIQYRMGTTERDLLEELIQELLEFELEGDEDQEHEVLREKARQLVRQVAQKSYQVGVASERRLKEHLDKINTLFDGLG